MWTMDNCPPSVWMTSKARKYKVNFTIMMLLQDSCSVPRQIMRRNNMMWHDVQKRYSKFKRDNHVKPNKLVSEKVEKLTSELEY